MTQCNTDYRVSEKSRLHALLSDIGLVYLRKIKYPDGLESRAQRFFDTLAQALIRNQWRPWDLEHVQRPKLRLSQYREKGITV
jgi:hypothetical protein